MLEAKDNLDLFLRKSILYVDKRQEKCYNFFNDIMWMRSGFTHTYFVWKAVAIEEYLGNLSDCGIGIWEYPCSDLRGLCSDLGWGSALFYGT